MTKKVLSYIYIKDYKHLKNVGIKFDNAYDINYDAENNRLSITNSKDYVPNMYGEGILSFTAIVGNNGVGKTTYLRCILETLVPGRSEKTPTYALFVWRDGDYFCYYNSEEVQFVENSIKAEMQKEVDSFITFFFSSEFKVRGENVELAGSYIYTNMALLNNDIQSYANIENHYNDSYQQRLNAYVYQNMFRIAGLIANYRDLLEELKFNVPKYIMLYPNRSAYMALQNGVREKETESSKEVLNVMSSYMGNDMFCIIIHAILNKCFDLSSAFYTIDDFVANSEWLKLPSGGMMIDKYITECEKRIPLPNDTFYDSLRNVYKNINENFNVSKAGVYYLDISTKEGIDKYYDFLNECYNSEDFLVARFFDLLPTFEIGKYCTFSSGEAQIYNMLSRIIYAKENALKFGKELPQILLLDEMETGLHPEWQKEFISVLTKFISKVFGTSVQIIMTTHSPIILSDLLRTNVQYLQRTKDGRTENVSAKQKDTFASNIFDLYKNAFFLEDGFIGKYAMSKLTELDKKLRKKPNDMTKEDACLIHNIGDNRIKSYFINLADIEIDKEKEIKMLEKRLMELKGEER